MFTKLTHRRLTGLAVTIAAVVTSAGVASAAPPAESGIVTREQTPDTAWYPDAEDGLVLLYGPRLGQGGCTYDENFPYTTLSRVEQPNGTIKMHAVFVGGPIQVHESDDPWAFIQTQCELVFDGDPATVADEPIASGTGNLVLHWWIHPDGSLDVHNWVVGRVEDADGSTRSVRAEVRYSVTAEGEFVLDVLDIDY